MGSRFISPFVDVGSGIKPSSGAKLYFYETGTSTPKNTYSDQGDTTANANPVIADANGVFSDIFISGQYKVVLKDKNGTQIWEADPVLSVLTGESIGVYGYATLASAIASQNVAVNQALNIQESGTNQGFWDVVLASSVVVDGQYTVLSTNDATLALVKRTITPTQGRDVASLIAPSVNLSSLQNAVLIEKLRDTTYEEFCVYTPLSSNGIDWCRWLFTNRFNVTNDGAPRMIMSTLASLNPSLTVARTAANNVSETTATATTATRTSSTGTNVGTWVGPATVLTTTDVEYSALIGDTITYTITGVERIVMRGLMAGNGGIAEITITESAVEIPEANYLIPADHLINFISTATGNTTMHFPLADGLTSGSTYTVEIKVDASNPVGNRVYQAGLLGYADIAFDDTGISGVVLDDPSSLAGQSNALSVAPGTRAVYTFTNTTKIDWQYVETPTSSVVTFIIYDSVGTEITTYQNQTIDQYGVGSTAKVVTVATSQTKGTYYLHVINGKTKNASASAYRYYDFGAIGYDQTLAGVIGTDIFDNYDVPDNMQDPNNDSGQGTEYMFIGTGNLEMAIDIRKTTDAIGTEEFVGGIHGHETTPVPVFKIDDVVIDYAAAAIGDTFTGKKLDIGFTTTLSFPSDSSDFATVNYLFSLTQAGYLVDITKTTINEAIVHDDFAIMLNAPNTDTSQGIRQPQGLAVGGGFKNVAADKNYVFTSFDNAGTTIQNQQRSVAFANLETMVSCAYVTEPVFSSGMELSPFISTRTWSLVQDRTDRTVKFYTDAYNGNDSDGITVPALSSWQQSKIYRVARGNFESLIGII